MNMQRMLIGTLAVTLALGLLLTLTVGLSQAQRPGARPGARTTFTYQGRLTDGGSPADGTYDFQFTLYDAANDGASVGSAVTVEDVTVIEGLFTVQLDFGSVFDGTALWLEIGVRPGDSDVAYTTLSPRQELTGAPYALYALNAPWSGLMDVPAGLDDGDDNTTYSAGDGLTLADTTFSADTTFLQRRVSGTCTSGNAIRVVNEDGSVTCEPVAGAADPHDHWGESWSGSGTGLSLDSRDGTGLRIDSAGEHGVRVNSAGDDGVYVRSVDGAGVHVHSAVNEGVWVHSAGYGVAVDSASYDGVYVVSADGDGVHVQSADDDGLDVQSAGRHGLYVGSAGGAGLRVDSATNNGVYVASAGDDGVDVESVGDDGLDVESAGRHGLYVGSAATDGVHVGSAGDDGVDVYSADGDGVHVSHAGDDAVEATGDSYAGVFWGDVYVDGLCVDCSLAVFAHNAGQATLEPGDVVAVRGVTHAELSNAPVVLRVNRATGSDIAIGVVAGRAELDKHEDRRNAGKIVQRLVPREGPAQPGEYVNIIVYGLAQAKASALAGTIQPSTG